MVDDLGEISIAEEKIIQIDILNAVHEFCISHGIKYFLLYGTLLGAVRHNGFIPWDDDIDIGMFREDYNLFFECFNQSSQTKGSTYEAINIDTDNKYYLPMGKVIDKRTILLEEVDVKFPLGVYIDVFPIDYLPDSKDKCIKIVKKIGAFEKLLAYKQCLWSKKYSVIKNLFHIVMKVLLMPFSNYRICKKINRLASKYKNGDSKHIGSITLGVYGEKEIWYREDFENTIVKEFEGKEYSVPAGFDNLLCRIYGDYMTLPPKEKQISHHKNIARWKQKQSLYYITNYPCFEKEHYRDANRAAALQSEYLAQALSEIGYKVSIVSTGISNIRSNALTIDSRFNRTIDSNVTVVYFTCINSKFGVFRVMGRYLYNREVKSFIKKYDGIYIVYHSVVHYKINEWIKKYRRKLILEVEEIYADVTQNSDDRLKEIRETDNADAYIIPNCMMCPEVTRDKKWVLYHGTCKKEPKLEKLFNDGKIHIVYAGTMDPRKVGLMPSLDAALYLEEEKYHIHVLAVGYPDNQEKIKERISKLNIPHCQISFHDPLDGEEYLRFIQSCEIGLYTQGKEGIDIDTSFPSKLMSYMSNGLRIVATKTKPLELSEISDVIYFSESNSGEDIAKVIKSINFSDGYDGRRKAAEIHERLKKDLQVLLEEV